MSKTVDERVVEMRFDNKDFETNVSKTMSTLEKLKQKLNFSGASKGLDNLDAAAKKVNFSGMSTAIDTVQAKFSALSVVGVTALANIANSAVNTGKMMVSALTIDPVKTGLNEYETQINAIQTIMSNTRSKGTTLDDVNAALDELNKYADMTIYNFTEMTRNIGTFTAAGVGLNESVAAIKGIANLAAVSGSTSLQASTAMYQLSQALAAGRVSLMDWNSVVNAGMGGELFQTALKRTAENMGTNVDALIETYGSFRESLTQGQWLTADVLTETLAQISGAYTEADLISQGYTEEQAKEITALADDAVAAATKVKTFTQLWDTMKEATQSGWTNTWELIIGDFEGARTFLSEVSDYFGEIINTSAESRNALLEGALSSNYQKITDKLEDAGISAGRFEEILTQSLQEANIDTASLIETYGSLEAAFQNGAVSADYLKSAIDKVSASSADLSEIDLGLDYGAGFSEKGLEAQSEDVAEIQRLLIDLGYDLGQFGDAANGVDGRLGEMTQSAIRSFQEINGLEVTGIIDEATLEKMREAQSLANGLGDELKTLADDVGKLGGRQLLIDSFWNIVEAVQAFSNIIGDAWNAIFPPITSDKIYSIIEAFNKFTEGLIISGDNASKVQRIFEGVFSVFKIFGDVIRTVFDSLKPFIGEFSEIAGGGILDFLAKLGDSIKNFANSGKTVEYVSTLIQKLIDIFKAGKQYVEDFASALGFDIKIPSFDDITQGLANFIDIFKNINIGSGIFSFLENLQNSFTTFFDSILGSRISSVLENLRNSFTTFFDSILGSIKIGDFNLNNFGEILGSFFNDIFGGFEVPKFNFSFITDFIDSLKQAGDNAKNGISGFIDGFGKTFQGFADFIINFNWGGLAAALMGAGIIVSLYKFGKGISSVVELLSSGIEGINDVISGFHTVMNSFSDTLKSVQKTLKAKAMKDMAISIAILVGSIALLTQLDPAATWGAVLVIGALAGILIGMSAALNKFSEGAGILQSGKVIALIISLGVSMLMLSAVMKIISGMTWEDLTKAAAGILGLGGIITGLIAATKLAGGNKIDEVGTTILKMTATIGILAVVAKLIATMTWEDMGKAAAGILSLGAIITGLIAATKLAGGNKIDEAGSTILKMAVAIGIFVVVAKLIAGMSWDDMGKAAAGILGLGVIITGLIAATKLAGGHNVDEIGSTIFKIAAAIGILAVVARLIAGMSWEDMGKAAVGILGLSGIIAGLIAATKLAGGNDLAKVGATLLMLSISIGILAGVCIVLGLVDPNALAQGVVAVGILGALVALMIASTKDAKNVKSNIMMIAIAIGVMAASIAVLSFIEPEKLAGATAAIAILMGMFALILKSSGAVNASMGVLIVMDVAIALIAGSIAALSLLPTESVLTAAASITLVMIALSAMFAVVGSMKTVSVESIPILGAVVIALGLVAVILGALTALNVAPSLETALSLSAMLLAMAGVVAILSKISPMATGAIAAAGAFDVVVAIIGGLMVGLGVLMKYVPQCQDFLDNGIDVLIKIAEGIGKFFGTIVDSFLTSATANIEEVGTNLSNFMNNAQGFIDGAKNIDSSVLDGIGVLTASILALVTGDAINRLIEFFTGKSSFESFGENMVQFGSAIKGFGDSVAGIDVASISSAASVGGLLVDIANSIPNTGGLIEFFTGTKDMASFASNASEYGKAIVSFSNTISGLNTAGIEVAVSAGQLLVDLNNSIPNTGGLVSFFTGEKDLSSFAANAANYGKGIKEFANSVIGLDTSGVEAAVSAGDALVGLNDTLPNTGGLVGFFIGEKDLSTFGKNAAAYGEGIKQFAASVIGLDTSGVEAAVSAGDALVDLNDTLPNTGGLISFFTGEKDLGNFGENAAAYGEGIKKFADSIVGIDSTSVGSAVEAGKALSDILTALDNTGGVAQWFSGEKDLGSFGKGISELGGYLKDFSDKVSTIDTGITESATSVVTSLSNVLSTIDANNVQSQFSSVGKGIEELGACLNSYYWKVSEIDTGTISSVITYIIDLKNAISDMSTIDLSGVSTFGDAIESLSSISFDGFDESMASAISTSLSDISNNNAGFFNAGSEFAGKLASGFASDSSLTTNAMNLISDTLGMIESTYPSFDTSGKQIDYNIGSGILNASGIVNSSMASTLSSCLSFASGYSSNFYSVGLNIAYGLANGMGSSSAIARVRSQAYALANSAYQAAQQALDSHSPSRKFIELGEFSAEGLSIGMNNAAYMVEKSSKNLGDSALRGTADAIARLGEISASDIDTQPVIRPVLDLSNVTNGARTINSLLSMNRASSISASINQNRKYDPNDAIVGAIDGLRKDLGKVGGTSYNINGITYDDGSNISEAVRTLVRAVRTEGRV